MNTPIETNDSVSISNYLEWVKEVHNVEGPIEDSYMYQDHVYFRGHASISWDLVPSLFRDIGRKHDEHKMLLHASNMLWTELNDCKSNLEKMIRLQHYGLHTRLLDVTFNPLVALFFACQTSSNPDDNKNGIVYCGYEDKSSKKVCMAIADYVFNNNAISINDQAIDQICQQYDIQKCDLESIYFITPPLNNLRITMQNGAFIMSPLLKEKEDWPFNDANRTYIHKGMQSVFKKKYTIPEKSKKTILKELDYLGFNKATIYTDIGSKLQYINEKEDSEWPYIDLA